jgi:hypothetical protein
MSTIRDVVVTMAPAQVRQTIGVHALGSSITAQPIGLSSYNGLLVHLQGNVTQRFYTYSKAETWGCVLGELFD